MLQALFVLLPSEVLFALVLVSPLAHPALLPAGAPLAPVPVIQLVSPALLLPDVTLVLARVPASSLESSAKILLHSAARVRDLAARLRAEGGGLLGKGQVNAQQRCRRCQG